MMKFEITAHDRDTLARAARIHLSRATVDTPAFMPVATLGAIKGLDIDRLAAIGYRLILSNSYHLYLRPRIDIVQKYCGLHNFMHWDHGILTDSGGFQLFSLDKFATINDEGVTFQSHIDGSRHALTPEDVIDIQLALGSDIIMPLDHCTSPDASHSEAQQALTRTAAWLTQSVRYLHTIDSDTLPTLFAILQGNMYADLRCESIHLHENCAGVAIGGLSVGESATQYRDMLHILGPALPIQKPHYGMGIGTPDYIVHAIAAGIDMFDSVFPTRVARNGLALTHRGRLNIRSNRCRTDHTPIDESCACRTCRRYTRAYLAHLAYCNEIMSAIHLCEHNLFYMYELMSRARTAIHDGDYRQFMDSVLRYYEYPIDAE